MEREAFQLPDGSVMSNVVYAKGECIFSGGRCYYGVAGPEPFVHRLQPSSEMVLQVLNNEWDAFFRTDQGFQRSPFASSQSPIGRRPGSRFCG